MNLQALQEYVEAVSLRYGENHQIERTDDWLMLKLAEEVGELTQAYLAWAGRARDKGFSTDELSAKLRSEVADVLGHTLLLAERFGVDLVAEVQRKWLVVDQADAPPAGRASASQCWC